MNSQLSKPLSRCISARLPSQAKVRHFQEQLAQSPSSKTKRARQTPTFSQQDAAWRLDTYSISNCYSAVDHNRIIEPGLALHVISLTPVAPAFLGFTEDREMGL
jgi:hypothetical protein